MKRSVDQIRGWGAETGASVSTREDDGPFDRWRVRGVFGLMMRTLMLVAVGFAVLLGGRPGWSQDTHASRVAIYSPEESEGEIEQEQSEIDLVPLSTAAKAHHQLRKHISVHLKSTSLEEALRTVAVRAGLSLSYGSETFEGTKKVTLERERITVYKALQVLLQSTKLILLVSPSAHLVVTDRAKAKRQVDVEWKGRIPKLERVPISSAEVKTVRIDHTVSGTVTEAGSGEPLPGVNIVVQGTSTGTTTDASGQYSLTVPGPESVLIFSLVGYQTREFEVGDRTTLNVQLQEDVRLLEEVVVTGYGTQRREEVTGSVSSVDVEEASTAQLTSPQEMIQGRLAGVSVSQNSGEPGAGISIRIRGVSSISAGSEPLYVVDGVPFNTTTITPSGASPGGVTASGTTNPLALLNPQDIESIDVLKDAAATAIYGSQGANGVVLIGTKGGETGSAKLSYSGKTSFSTVRNKLDMADGDRYRRARQELLGLEPTSEVNTDWQEETMRTAVTHEHNVSASGGNESTTYRTSLSYLENQGILRNSGVERVTGRVNARHSFTSWLRMNARLTGNYLKRNHLLFQQAGGAGGGVIKGMLSFSPVLPLRDEEGQFNEFARGTENPVALAERITDITDETRILGNVSMEVDLLENLTAKGTLGLDVADGVRRTFIPGEGPPLWIGQRSNGLARQGERNLSTITVTSTAEYDREFFGNHGFSFLTGYEFKREVFQSRATETRDFLTDVLSFNNLGAGNNVQDPFSLKEQVEQISLFWRTNYAIQDKYLVQGTLRRDGSSVFGENERFAWFPSASIGWRMSEEPFMGGVGWLNQLKIRGSWGISGNQAVPPFEALATLSPNPAFSGIFGAENISTGVAQERMPNPDLKWEETTEWNLGVDFTAGRFDGSVDFYTKTTEDLLLDVRVPPPTTSSFVLENVGEIENTGVEFALNALVFQRDDWSLNVGGTISSNKNEITDLGGRGFIDHSFVSGPGQTGVTSQRLDIGKPIGSFYGPVFTGIGEIVDGDFVSIDEMRADDPDAAGVEVYEAEGGGFTTNVVEARRAHLGNPIPDVAYSFNLNLQYKPFDVSAFFRGEEGREIFNNTGLEFGTKSNLPQKLGILEDALEDGTATSHTPVYSSRWIQDASFLRLDNLTVGYTVPNPGRLSLQRARVYVSGQNLFVLTPYEGFDPEVNTNVDASDTGFRAISRPDRGIDYTSYPTSRTFTIGVQIGI